MAQEIQSLSTLFHYVSFQIILPIFIPVFICIFIPIFMEAMLKNRLLSMYSFAYLLKCAGEVFLRRNSQVYAALTPLQFWLQ